METETIDTIISASDMINTKVKTICDINKQIDIMEDQIKRSQQNDKLKQYLETVTENLQIEKDSLIKQVVALRKKAIGIMFKDSGNYTYIDDVNEFNSNKDNMFQILENQDLSKQSRNKKVNNDFSSIKKELVKIKK